MSYITPEMVRAMTAPSGNFLCSIEDNTDGIEFLEIRMKDYENNQCFFEDAHLPPITDETRLVSYEFSANYLSLEAVNTQTIFKVGAQPVKDLLLIERNYFKNELIKSYEFCIPFCIPNSQNCWETMYEMPWMSTDLQTQMINCPWERVSDHFYFIEGKLVIHHKSQYKFV